MPPRLAFVDVETTGLNPRHDRVIEIGVVLMEKQQILKTYTSLIDPDGYLPPEISSITGITSQDLAAAPTFRNVSDKVFSLLKDSVFVAHNARFDYAFIKNEFSRLHIPFTATTLCTARLSKSLFPGRRHHSLDDLITAFNLPCSARHRALPDAEAIAQFYLHLVRTLSPTILESNIQPLVSKSYLPSSLPPDQIKSLPSGPGVYIFYGLDGLVLYVGKSINLKDRVLSHFRSDYSSSKELKISHQITSLETISTSGELSALLLESSLIKKLSPLYNRQLRYARQLMALVKDSTSAGYFTAYLAPLSDVPGSDLARILGVFKSRSDLRQTLTALALEHQLCPKLLGLETGLGACFYYQLNQCRGACLGREPALAYNLRFLRAFSASSISPWPFSGPIVIKETDSFHLFNNWCYLGEYTDSEPIASRLNSASQFDLDTYKILKHYLFNSAHRSLIHTL